MNWPSAGSSSVGTDIVNEAYDATEEDSARALIERAEQTLYAMAETGKYGKGFSPSAAP
jgi:replicative DNA helicase